MCSGHSCTTVTSTAVTTCKLTTYTTALTPALLTAQATTKQNNQPTKQTNSMKGTQNGRLLWNVTTQQNATEIEMGRNLKGDVRTRGACSTGCNRLAVKIYATSWRSGKLLHDSVQPNYYMILCHLMKLLRASVPPD